MNVNKIQTEEDSKGKNTLRSILKEVGFADVNPSWDSTLKCFTVMKVLNPHEADTVTDMFLDLATQQGLKIGLRQYEPDSDIWVFKLYI